MKKLYKSNRNKMIVGVCGGIAEYFDLDATLVRLAFVIVTLFWGTGILVYVLAALIVPTSMQRVDDSDVDNLKSANIDDEENVDENKASSESKKDSGLHSDEEFDAFFKR